LPIPNLPKHRWRNEGPLAIVHYAGFGLTGAFPAMNPRLLLSTFVLCLASGPALAQDAPIPATPEPLPGAPPSVLPIPVPPVTAPPVVPQPVQPEVPSHNRWRYIVVHHSATPSGNAASMHRMHRSKGWDGLAYHFVITNGKGGADGELQVGQRWKSQKHGAHAGGMPNGYEDERNGYNEFGIGICLVGNFQHRAPTRAQLRTLAKLINKLRGEFDIPAHNVVGHRHVKGTACPGRLFPWKSLYAMMGLPKPRHLYKRIAYGTEGRCPWCIKQHGPGIHTPTTVQNPPVTASIATPPVPAVTMAGMAGTAGMSTETAEPGRLIIETLPPPPDPEPAPDSTP
jgi:N-acetyl-anhydromuramyl-L-alanine amidase AmpD